MVLQLGLPVYAETPEPGNEEVLQGGNEDSYEYVEITDNESLTSGDIYAIVYTAGSTAAGGNILYHKDSASLSDQVTGQISGNRLTLDDVSRFPEEAQTWVIDAAEGGYTVKSCSGTDMYLSLSQLTSSMVPVTNTPEALTISAVEGGFTISGTAQDAPSYLAHGSSGQFYAGAASCTLRIFKKTAVEEPVEPEGTLAIPGYTRVENAALDEGKYYMIVSQDSAGNLYAFYPDQAYKATDPGNAIDPKHARGCPEGTFVAALTVNTEAGTVSAKRATAEQTALEMKDLWFTVEQNGEQWGFVDANGLYLAMQTDVLTEAPAYFAVSADPDGDFTLESGTGRWLDFNKSGDPNQFKTFATNFWGPSGSKRFPIYLYTKDEETPPPTVSKAALKAAITEAQALDTEIYDENSKAALKTALDAAIEERDSQDSTTETVAAATKALREAMQAMRPKDEFLAPEHPNPATGTTQGQPFPTGTGGSQTFRIPALITLNDGSLAAGIDARWDACPDGYGIDSLFSVSSDNGATWNYNFPNYFNDSTDAYYKSAAAFIDPVMIQDQAGTIYYMTDVFPGGHYIFSVDKASGYIEINGTQRMVLYTTRSGQSNTNYSYYVGDYEEGFAPVYAKDQDSEPAYYLDEYFNLYTVKKSPMYCPQIGSDKYVQQNVFYYHADLHVRNATYLWMVTSSDNGKTWSAPTIINPMVLDSTTAYPFYGVGPGAGLCLSDGTIMLPCYNSGRGQVEHSSFIYKAPNDDTWHRSEDATAPSDRSSESALVEIDANTVRQFYRDDVNVLRYTDHTRNKDGTWSAGEPVRVEGITKTVNNQISAIRYSKEIGGKPVILVSTAATGNKARENGKIYAFHLEADHTMTHIGTYQVTEPGVYYGYSSLTELEDGSIGLLYEDGKIGGIYWNIAIEDIIWGLPVDGKQTVVVPLYGTVENSYVVPTEDDLKKLDQTIVTAELKDGKVLYTGVKLGTTTFTTASGIAITIQVQEPETMVTAEMAPNSTIHFPVSHVGEISHNTNPEIATAKIETIDKQVSVNGGQGNVGNDEGRQEHLASALHTFVADGAGFQVSAASGDTQVWLNPDGTNGFPFATQAKTIFFEYQEDGTFFIKGESGTRYLAFWRDGKNVFDGSSSCTGAMEPLCKFKLYRPAAEGEISSEEIPGYIQIIKENELENGGFYLIAAEYNGEHYLVRPSVNSSDKSDHVLKVDKNADTVEDTVTANFHTMTVTSGASLGTTDIVFDGNFYRIEVRMPSVNKDALIAAINRAEETDTGDFTQESAAALADALKAAIEERDSVYSTKESVKAATDTLIMALQAMRPKDELMAPERPNPDHGVTTGEPFPTGIGGSETFRIPALITLNDGSLAAAIDARWDNCPDGFGIDTLFSRSTDGGKTWEYTFPNYFNDSVDQYWGGGKNQGNATAFLDPVMIQGKDGTIYLMTDVYSGGTFILNASTDSGYELIDGVERLAIHYSRDGQAGTYDFYVGDFVKAEGDEKAFAPLIARGDVEKKAAYYVDNHYYLYTADKQPMYCKQLGTNEQPWSGKYVQQNVFYYNADLHVRRATFLWMVTSNDNGKTWSAPTIMNPMVRKRPATHRFYGVGPGAGLCLDDGTILLPCYLHTPERSSFIYKNPGEDTWHRSQDASTDTSSESALVQIDENRVRQFCRDQHNVLRYTDHIRDPETMTWTAQEPVLVNGVPKTTMNQISAIRYSGKINDKPVILVSTAATGTGTRENGKIYAFNLENDAGRTMTLIGTYVVNQPGEVYGYSSLTELPDGSISLLYEDTWTHATYKNILLNEIIPSAIVDGKRTVVVPLYQSVEDAFEFEALPTEDELAQMDSAIATAKVVDGKVLYTGNKVGETSYVVDGVTVIVRVTDPEDVQNVALEVGESQEIEVEQGEIQRNTDPSVVDAVITTVDKSITVTGGQGHTGTDAAYNGALEPLAKGLHMFVADGDGFQVFGRNEASQRVWLNAAGTNGYPFSKQPVTTYFEQQDDGTFFITTEGRYLAFWRNGSNIFDAGSSASGELYKFKLYRPAEDGEASSEELPGYVRIQQAAEIKDGGFYLIAAEYDGDNYILWPSTDSSSKYAHIVKADKAAESVTHKLENQFYTLTLTGKSAGTADVVVNDIIYRVSVAGGESFVTTYPITVEQSDNGTVTASRTRASRGLTITLTAKADEGYELGVLTVVDKNGNEVKLTGKGDGKYSFTMPASAVAVRAEFVAESSSLPFTDVSVNDWFYSAVKYVYGNELMNGTSSNTFAPFMTTDRAMIVTILWRLEGSPVVNYAMDFGDVENGVWYTEAVRWAASEGIVTGYSDAVFAPGDTVTREQLAVILYRYAESQGYDVSGKGDLTAFSDGGKTSPWAVKAMEWAVGAKILSGKGGDVLDPTGTATRAEVAQIYMNFAQDLNK